MQQFQLNQLAKEQSRLQSEYNDRIDGNNIIIVGPTGCGKSTLISHILGKQLDISCIHGQFNIQHNDEDFKIGNSTCTSETTKCTSQQMNNLNFWDCPGFRATNGQNQDILTSFNLFYLMKYSKQYKIILVVCVDCFKAKKNQGFIEILNQLTQYFGNSVDQILQSVLLIVTKVPNKEINIYKQQLQKVFQSMLNSQQQNGIQLTSESMKLLGSFIGVNHSEKVIVCGRPDVDQTNTYHYQLDTSYLHNCIDKLTYCKTNNVKLSLDVQAQSQIQLQFQDLKDQVNFILIQLQHQLIQSHCNKDIKLQLINIQNQDQQQYNNGSNSRYQIGLKALKQIFDNNQHDTIIQQTEELYNIINQINFIQDNILTLECQPFEIDQRLNALVNEAWKQIVEYYNIKSQQTETELCICGNIISLSDIITEVSQYQQSSIDNIYVYCIDSILLDRSIQLNGINLTINAQKWSMSNIPITIDLSGKDGEQHEQSKAANGQGYNAQGNGNNGVDGLHGRHGKDGGNFIGIGKDYDDLKQLTIITSGGKGSNGQDGGDGSNGKDGNTNGEQMVRNRDSIALKQRRRKQWMEMQSGLVRKTLNSVLTLNEKRIEIYVFRGSDGKQGGNSGLQGKGGISGKPGTIQIQGYQYNNYISKQTQHPNGNDGLPGQVGKGGKQFQWLGQYQNDVFLPITRKSNQYVNYVETNPNEPQLIKQNRVEYALMTYGASLILQGIGSMVSAQINSYWSIKPYLLEIELAPDGQVNVISNQYVTPYVPNSVSQLNFELFNNYTLNNIQDIQQQDNIIGQFIKQRVLESRK